MSSDVVLSAALRSNLLSLQNTQRGIDATQFRLATGRKVNSALDNPQSFFAAQGLNNRANDLGRLLDGIGQSIQVIKAADNGISALTKLVEQADSIANSARDAVASASESALAVGNRDVSDFTVANAYDGATITFSFTDADGVEQTVNNAAVTLNDGDTMTSIINSINSITDDNGNQVVEARLNASGQLSLKTMNGLNMNVSIDAGDEGTSAALAFELGYGNIARATGNDDVAFSAKAAATLDSGKLYRADGETTARRSDLLVDILRDDNGDGTGNAGILAVTGDADDGDSWSINIGLNNGVTAAISVDENTTIQSFIDEINNNGILAGNVRAEFNEETGAFSLRVLDKSVQSIELSVTATDGGQDNSGTIVADFGFGITGPLSSGAAPDGESATSASESIRLGEVAGELGQFEADFNRIREQIDQLVADSSYRGTNLLNGDDLTTFFNENRTSSLTTQGRKFTAEEMGISMADFSSAGRIDAALEEVREALNSVRNFGASLANDLAVIQTRETFTEELINTLTEGSDKLTIADQNEEGAKLLALQTRQQLGVTSLSLASQSQQSILRLF